MMTTYDHKIPFRRYLKQLVKNKRSAMVEYHEVLPELLELGIRSTLGQLSVFLQLKDTPYYKVRKIKGSALLCIGRAAKHERRYLLMFDVINWTRGQNTMSSACYSDRRQRTFEITTLDKIPFARVNPNPNVFGVPAMIYD